MSLALVLLLTKPSKGGLQQKVRMELSPRHKDFVLWVLNKLLGHCSILKVLMVPSPGLEAAQRPCLRQDEEAFPPCFVGFGSST